LDNLSETWKAELEAALDSSPSAIGEIGLDSWRKPFDRDLQDRVFSEQLHIAAQRGIPASIHGLRAWDRVLVTLRQSPRPSCGVLLHSYGGPLDLVPHFVRLGAYFSCPGFFLRPGNEGKLALYKEIPLARLLIESDAPDQALPEALDTYRLPSVTDGKRINHPASVITTYRALAELRGINEEELQLAVYENFMRLFGDIVQRRLAKS
jgi:TatD DNase family protein